MDWLNYHHLLYFWAVAREGSISAACQKLHLAQPTISGQLKKLEEAVGQKLYDRVGRGLVLTDAGRTVFRYADEIFSIGEELKEALKGRPTERPLHLTVGVPDSLPKMIAYRLIEPAFRLDEKVHVECREGKLQELLGELATHSVDVVLSDMQAASFVSVRAFNHFLGESDTAFYAAPELAKRLSAAKFPQCLNGNPMLLPCGSSTLRRTIDHWIYKNELRPEVVGDFEDTALMKVFAQAGHGVIPAPSVVKEEICYQYGLEVVGRVPELIERFYAITVERRIKHPAVIALSEAARSELFS
ncbi:MAG: transcriptional activator NhaR [Planctomycetaceae bacterium]|jgi:LysR family transcriptional activator of nhaA|nr:transcriptional activator NhaR [Planctomycetaceae bacterium]